MKVLIITEGYFPGNNYGGPPVSINNLCRLLKDKADFFIITNDQIGVYGADGDGIPEIMIKESESEDDILKVNFSYEMLYTVDEFNYVGSGTAVFSRNPSGLFGYTLENVFLDK